MLRRRLVGMAYVTQEQLRTMLVKKIGSRRNAVVSREIGVKPQNLHIMSQGAPIVGKVLAWLGYEKVNDLYRRRKA
jgi:hypothetical protein